MGSGQRFRLSLALKRTKSSAPQPNWPPEGNEHKVQHLLGITATDLNTARNQSISSSVAAKIPTLSFSDATTELGSYNQPPEHLDTAETLHLKASSVLLHEDFLIKAGVANSTHSKRLKTQGSASTLNSFYDVQKTPLAISQQTSESSRRDFALRKGAPVVIKSKSPDKDSLRQLKFFRLSRSGDKSSSKKSMKPSQQSQESIGRMLSGSRRSTGSSGQAQPSGFLTPSHQSSPKKGVRFNSDRSVTTVIHEKPTPTTSVAQSPLHDCQQVKMNIRRPKAGAKYWFDGLQGDSSGDESVHEPEFQPSFVTGMELAFEGGRIGSNAKLETRATAHTPETSSRSARSRTPPSHTLPPSAIPPRVSTLNAKSSRSTLSQKESHMSSPKTKAGSLASTDLRKTSVLDLSSSDDDEPSAQLRKSAKVSLPPLRDSIVFESLGESEIETGIAQAISTKNTALQATPSLKRVRGGHSRRANRLPPTPAITRRDPRLSYYSDLSSNPTQEEDELLTSFPATPSIDQATSYRQSVQGPSLSDTASIESRRLMSVTKQEESLLAAIRSRKATLDQSHRACTDPRLQVLMNKDRKPLKRNQRASRSSVAYDVPSLVQTRMPGRMQSPTSDANFDQGSCTTFQTGPSNDASARYSMTSFRTDPETDIASSLGTSSPALLQPSSALNRMSRSTFFSSSSNSSRDNSRNRKESHIVATLEKLQATPTRDEVTSQDFIDWPYNGWMKVATAH